jgi:hypothetical protein
MTRPAAWFVLIAVVVIGAVVQGLTAAAGSAGVDEALVWAAVGSLVLLWLEAVALVIAAAGIAGMRASLRAVAAGCALALGAGVLVALLVPLALPVVVVLALIVLPAVAAGHRPLAVFRRSPWRAVAAIVVSLVLAALTWVIAFAAGFFLTTVSGGIVLWLWLGIAVGALLVWWARLHARATARAAASVTR